MPVVPALPVFSTRGQHRRQLHGGAPEGQTSAFDNTSVPQGRGCGGGRGHGRGRAIEIHPPRTEPPQNIDQTTSAEHRHQSPSPIRESPPLPSHLYSHHYHYHININHHMLFLYNFLWQDVHMLKCTLSIILEVEYMFVNIVGHYIGMMNDLE